MIQSKPEWVPEAMPALDGLRGAAILLVLVEHCAPRLAGLGLGRVASWGWIGVDLFFVLSGFLITGIVLDGRRRERFFGNFYARRGLRILPVLALVVAACVVIFGSTAVWTGRQPYWLYFALFLQNLVPGLNGALYPAWSLAIEEQYYLVWAPLARRLPAAALAGALGLVLAVEPWVRSHHRWFVPVHTLYHLDGLAVGSLIALGLRATRWPRRVWERLAWGGLGTGLVGAAGAVRWYGPAVSSAVALGFGGLLLLAVLGETGAGAVARGLRLRPLRGLGRISYGLYMVHMPVFMLLGGLDAHMDAIHAGAVGDLAIVATRWAAAMAVATALWFGFERPMLSLKRKFA
ncbi:MAG TPA: acyltransferase [Terriglobales bacterium]|nr:acyltransferase [Terriglobales bacterium]